MTSGFCLTQAIRRAVAIKPDAPGVIDGAFAFTWRSFADRVARLAAAFIELGVRPGDRIVLLALNSHRTLECFYAAMWAGGVIVPLNHRLGQGEIVAQVNDCSPKLIMLGPDFVSLALVLRDESLANHRDMVHCAAGQAPDGFLAYEDLIAAHQPVDDAGRCDNDLACLLYTSGTTSAAKGVMLSHANFCANTASVAPELGMDQDTVHLHHGPLFHVASAARLFSTTHVAGTHVFLPRFVASEVVAEVVRSRVTHATFVPTMFRMLLDDPSPRPWSRHGLCHRRGDACLDL